MSNDNCKDNFNKEIDYDKLTIVKESLIEALDGLNGLPPHAMNSYITHYDYAVVLMTIKAVVDSFLTKKEKEETIENM